MRRLSLLVIIVASISGCSEREVWPEAKPGQAKVLVSFPPLYCFAANVAGEHAVVKCLLTGAGPHDYHPTALDSLKVRKADLFLVNGLELDDFVTAIVRNAGNKKPTGELVFKVGDALPDKMLIHLSEDERQHFHEDGTSCTQGEHDPHVWLGPEHAAAIVQHIAKKFSEIDPANSKGYEVNADIYTKKLKELHDYGRAQLSSKQNRRIITTHDSLRYFAQAYGLEIVGSIRPQPGQEADAGQLGKLADLCQTKEVHAIMIEPQYSPRAAEALCKQATSRGAQVQLVEFDPMETARAEKGGNPDPDLYLRRMRQNIDNLAKALP
jgi:zinc transport system substrate-binding protein